MAFDFDTLTGAKSTAGSIKSWCNHGSVDAVGALIQAEAWIYSLLRASEMRQEATVDLNEGEMNVAPPDDFLAPIQLKWRGDSNPVRYVHEALLDRFRDQDTGEANEGRPLRYAIFANLLQFEVMADEDLTADFVYYGTPDALSSGNPTNFLTTRFPTLLRATCMAFGYQDRSRYDRADVEFVRARALIDEANAVYDRERAGQDMQG